MKDRTLLLAGIMLLSIGTSSVVYVAHCKTPHLYDHHTGTGCQGGSGNCFGCDQDKDTGGCEGPDSSPTACKAIKKPRNHVNLPWLPINFPQTRSIWNAYLPR